MKRVFVLALGLVVPAACHDFNAEIAACVDAGGCVTDAGPGEEDAGLDAGEDAGFDAGVDAGLDAGMDAGVDGGTDGGADGGTDAGVDAGVDAGIVYTLRWNRFAPLAPLPYDGGVSGYRILESTFAQVQRVCSADGGVCVTGAIEP